MGNVLCIPIIYTVQAGEHNGHVDEFGNPLPHSGNITGTFSTGSDKLKVMGIKVILHGATSPETCFDDGGGSGTMNALPCKVKVGGVRVAMSGSSAVTHAGVTKVIYGGNSKLSVGG